MATPLDGHTFVSNMLCTRCKRSYEEIIDKQIHCVKMTCSRCQGYRICVNTPPVCEECWSYNPAVEY